MPCRLSFTRLSPFEQPLIFVALAFIGGLLFAARYSFAISGWLVIAIVWWLAATVCLLKWRTASAWLLLGGCFAVGGLLWTTNEASAGQTRVRSLFARGELRA